MRDVEQREQRRGYIADIWNSGAHLLALIDDILDYSKLEADRLPLSETVFDLRRFRHDNVRLVRVQAEAAGVALHLPVPPAIALKGDERRLRQCVVNLLANAINSRRAARSRYRPRCPVRPRSRSESPTPAAASRPISWSG